MKKIAILGATGHIGKALAHRFSTENMYRVSLFSRSVESMREFIDAFEISDRFTLGVIDDFSNHDFNIVINCIGIGNPAKLKANPVAIFELTEKYDNLIFQYLDKHPDTLYINMSSGAVYGKNTGIAVDVGSTSSLDMNALSPSDFYSVAKINSEAKHRSRPDLNIVDLRVFSFFSRFIDLDSGFMMAELVDCIMHNKKFHTSADDIIRDYTIADDLFVLIEKCIARHDNMIGFNDVFDVYSKEPVSKIKLMDYFKDKFGLEYEIKNPDLTTGQESSPTGAKKEYYSKNKKAENLGFVPEYSSIEGVAKEIKALLEQKTRH